MSNHKYLNDIEIKTENTPWGWNRADSRQVRWEKDREIYGFDERETWSLDTTFFYWLYERLSMYNEVNCINTKFHKFDINGETLTQQECIDRMRIGCKYYFKLTTGVGSVEDDEIALNIADEVLEIWKECIFSMWW